MISFGKAAVKKLKLHEAKACGVFSVVFEFVLVKKVKLHKAEACGVLANFAKGSKAYQDTQWEIWIALVNLISSNTRRCFKATNLIDLDAVITHAARDSFQHILRQVFC